MSHQRIRLIYRDTNCLGKINTSSPLGPTQMKIIKIWISVMNLVTGPVSHDNVLYYSEIKFMPNIKINWSRWVSNCLSLPRKSTQVRKHARQLKMAEVRLLEIISFWRCTKIYLNRIEGTSSDKKTIIKKRKHCNTVTLIDTKITISQKPCSVKDRFYFYTGRIQFVVLSTLSLKFKDF